MEVTRDIPNINSDINSDRPCDNSDRCGSRSVRHSTGIANSISGIEARWIVVQGFAPGDSQSRLICLGTCVSVSAPSRSLQTPTVNGNISWDDSSVFLTTPLGTCARRVCSTKPDLLVRVHPFICDGQTLTFTLDTHFWDTIFSMDITSAEGLSNFSTLVHSPSEIVVARSLRGDKAQSFIDIIDHVSDPGKHPLILRTLMMRHSFSCYRNLTRNYVGDPRGYSTKSAKSAGFCLPLISFSQNLPVSANSVGAVALRT